MEIMTILGIVIPVLALLWNVFRDKSGDTTKLNVRLSSAETSIILLQSNVTRLESQQEELKSALAGLETQVNQINVKLERVLTILENKKGA